MERNVLITIAYDGSYFHGWQVQENAYTVQACFQSALYQILNAEPDIKACSRTDTGVHAKMFCISVIIDNPITNERLKSALNHFLPEYTVCLDCRNVPADFHARYSCKGKEYVYLIHNSEVRDPFLDKRALHYWRPINEKLLDEAAKHFIGSHDFSAFCTMDARKKGNLRRTIYEASVKREEDRILFTVAGDGFLYNMVRIMAGTLLRVQQGKIRPEELPGIIEKGERALAGPTAPACGLYLNRVFYEEIQALK